MSKEVLDIIKNKSISFVIPNNDYSSEHITIELYHKTMNEEEWNKLKKELGL